MTLVIMQFRFSRQILVNLFYPIGKCLNILSLQAQLAESVQDGGRRGKLNIGREIKMILIGSNFFKDFKLSNKSNKIIICKEFLIFGTQGTRFFIYYIRVKNKEGHSGCDRTRILRNLEFL